MMKINLRPLLLSFLLLLQATTAYAWSFAVRPPHPFSMMRPPMVVITPPSSCLQQQNNANSWGGDRERKKKTSSNWVSERQQELDPPRYKLIDDEEKFQVAVDVAGLSKEDLRISIEEEGGDNELKFIKIEGKKQHTTTDDDDGETSYSGSLTSKFTQQFAVDPTVIDIDKISAKLVEGGTILLISAPKDLKRIEHSVRVIPIITTEKRNGSFAELLQVARDAGEPIEV